MEVEKLKRGFLFLFAIAFIFSFDIRALADEGHSHDQNIKKAAENFKNGKSNENESMNHDSGSDMEGMDHGSGSDMEGMNHGSGSDMEGMDMESESNGESHEHHEAVVETPPNYKILGTYGAVNLSFIIIGVWNKWFRRKGELNNGNA
jgi:hypothetical protein